MKADAALDRLLPADAGPRAFPDGADFRIEIPSVEGPEVLETVIAAAAQEGIVVNRVSQGSGAMLLREDELRAMAALGRDHGIEVLGLRELERVGASTVNVPSDVSVETLRELRAATTLPIDLYVESPDGLGGVVRGNELGDLVSAGAPLYAKFGLRNSRMIYPSGLHLLDEARSIAREKVRRAAIALEWCKRLSPDLVQSAPGAVGLGVPQPETAASVG